MGEDDERGDMGQGRASERGEGADNNGTSSQDALKLLTVYVSLLVMYAYVHGHVCVYMHGYVCVYAWPCMRICMDMLHGHVCVYTWTCYLDMHANTVMYVNLNVDMVYFSH